MNHAPLPQPAPFTCPDCGASLESKSRFCPRCGAHVENKPPAPPLSLGIVILLLLGLFVFGAIGACGGTFTYWWLDSHSNNSLAPQSSVFALSIPSLIGGVVGFIACLLPFFRRKR